MFSFADVKEKLMKGDSNFVFNKIEIPSISPTIAQLHQSMASRENALEYFTKVYEILINIEKRIEDV